VEICADYEFGCYYKKGFTEKKISMIKAGDVFVPALCLEAEAECNKHLGRDKRVEQIIKFLSKKTNKSLI